MRTVTRQLGEFVWVSAAAAVLSGLGSLATYLSCSLLVGGVTTLVLGLPLGLRSRVGWFGVGAAAVVVVLGGAQVGEVGRVMGGGHATASLREIAPGPDVTRFTVSEPARVDVARTVTRQHRHDTGSRSSPRRDHAIAPIVSAASAPGEPAHVYAACFNIWFDRSCSEAWNVATDELVRVRAEEEACYRELVPDGVNPEQVVFVYWDAPGRYLGELWSAWTRLLRIVALAWLALGGLALVGLAVIGREPAAPR